MPLHYAGGARDKGSDFIRHGLGTPVLARDDGDEIGRGIGPYVRLIIAAMSESSGGVRLEHAGGFGDDRASEPVAGTGDEARVPVACVAGDHGFGGKRRKDAAA